MTTKKIWDENENPGPSLNMVVLFTGLRVTSEGYSQGRIIQH